MEKRPILVIMAAGVGSRYGGNKQLDTMTAEGETIMDFSLFDAYRAGFLDAVIIIRKETEAGFRSLLDDGAAKYMNIRYAYQDKDNTLGLKLEDLCSGENLEKAKARTKPWGTAHAVLSAKDLIDAPFAVINADDFYGKEAFSSMFTFLSQESDSDSKYHFAMVGYRLDMTLSESGHVSRGVSEVTEDSMLKKLTERTMIMRRPEGNIAFSEDDGKTWTPIPGESPVSMNFWGFSEDILSELEEGFPVALSNILNNNPEKGEYYLPIAVDDLLQQGKADVRVLPSPDKWYGVTNREDKELVEAALKSMKEDWLYPEKLWT